MQVEATRTRGVEQPLQADRQEGGARTPRPLTPCVIRTRTPRTHSRSATATSLPSTHLGALPAPRRRKCHRHLAALCPPGRPARTAWPHERPQGHLIKYHSNQAARRFAARLRLLLEKEGRISETDLQAKCGGAALDSPLKDGLFDELPDLFDPGFTLWSDDFEKRRAWTNKETRVAAAKAERETAAGAEPEAAAGAEPEAAA